MDELIAIGRKVGQGKDETALAENLEDVIKLGGADVAGLCEVGAGANGARSVLSVRQNMSAIAAA